MKVNHDNILTFVYTPGKYFIIPDFQRPYSWDKANIDSFIEDLELVMLRNKKHYFGSIVFINEGNNNSTIIDGQQRATTVLLMLTALYHIATDRPSSSTITAEEIKEKYLYNKHDYSENVNRIKLRTVTTDNAIFEQIFERSFTENSKDSKLYQAYDHFYKYFEERNDLKKYVDVLENFEVVTIALDSSDDNPQKIFESINSTGKPLTDGDKIRNFALMLNDKKTREIVLDHYWKKIEEGLTDINKDYISDFFKYFLTSYLQKEVKIEQVYPEFKKLFNLSIGSNQDDIEKLETFYTNVLSYLSNYSFLKFNDVGIGNVYKPVIDRGFRLNFLKIETPYPFLMRVLGEYANGKIEDKELIKIFEVVESYLTRRIICNIPTTGLNNLFSTLHKDINSYLSEYPKEKYSDILGYILTNRSGGLRFPKLSEIQSEIKNNPIYSQRNYYINFVLSSIDDQSKESTLLKQIASGDIQLSIEHIMPQTLNRKWIEDLGENFEQIHQQYLHTLPNLTLTGYNSKYSNNDFESKKNVENGFNDSPLLINQFVKSFVKWDQSALEAREQWWLKQIDKIWPVPDSTFAPKSQEAEFTFYDDRDLTGSKVKAVIILGETIECDSWASVLENIMKKFFMLDENLYDYVTSDDFLHRYIKADKDALRTPNSIEGTSYYYENNTNTNLKRDIVVRLAEHLGLDKTDIKVII